MAAKKVGTTKPTGLSIARDGLKFTFKWKKGEKYADGQQLQYKIYTAPSEEVAASGRNFLAQGFDIEGTKWISVTVSSTADHKDITLTASNYYPTTNLRVYGIAFRVRGQADQYTKKGKTYDPQWSAWVAKTILIYAPPAPTITAEPFDNAYVNRSTYTWSTEVSATDKRPVKDVELQTVSKQDCPADVTGLEEWDSATPTSRTTADTQYYDETGLSGISKTRVVRICTRGIGGSSKWVYAKHVFAAPYSGELTSQTALYNESTHVWNIAATWSTPQDAGHPVDFYTLQYRIGKPSANMAVTADNSWTDLGSATSGDLAVQLTEVLAEDECLWLRVATSHDNHTGANAVFGAPVRAYTGKPAAPTSLAISASDLATRTVTISVKNNSAITDSKVAIVFQPSTNPQDSVTVAVLTGSGTITQAGIKCPDWSNTGTLGFKAYAYVGTETYKTGTDSVKRYNVVPVMQSDFAFTSGGIPMAPASVTAEKAGDDILVNWAWTWEAANQAEISWATKANAWESTDEPKTHIVSTTGPSHLYISDIEKGLIYFIRVRLLHDDGEEITYGPYSGLQMVNMTEAPQKPVLDVSTDAIKQGEELTCSWTYTSMDGTAQSYAAVYEVLAGPVYQKIAETTSMQHVTFVPDWAEGTQHDIVVKTVSESGQDSPNSDKVTITAAVKPTCTITQASVVVGAAGYELEELPLTVTVTGAGKAGQTMLQIVRLEEFVQQMPDESDFNGFAEQIVTQRLYRGEAQQTITLDDINPGTLNDTAKYRIIAVITDGYGQTAKDYLDFTVAWQQQAVVPEATVAIVDTVAYITIGTPAGAQNTDTIDVYRLSVDKPELIYKDAAFGDVIVDPYPTLGEYGGYRVVLKTKNGDFYTSEMEPAWVDYEAGLVSDSQYIDFDGYILPLSHNVELESGWQKDFKRTKYLGGHEEGDWLEGVQRNGSIQSVKITELDTDDIQTLRRLATYSGPAHIRSKDGSSYSANVNVSNEGMGYTSAGKVRALSLNIEATRRAELDGLLQADWEAL